jgi:Icc-related predicted phosphoesterase
LPLFRRRSKEATLKIFYAADIHGSEKCFGKFLNAAKFYEVDLLILGGDITGKALVPIVRREDGTYEAHLLGRTAVARDEAQLQELEKQIRLNGFYPDRVEPDELAELERDEQRLRTRFQDVMRRDTARWMDMADERLAALGVPCFAMPGNDDAEFVGDLLSGAKAVENCDDKIIDLAGFQILSLGYSNPTPWNSPRELTEDELDARIGRLADKLDASKPAIFNLHPPPHDSGLDNAPELRDDLSLKGGAIARMIPVGSTAVRRAVETFQPMLSLHGHIHESRGVARIGGCTSLNPGSEYNVGVLRGVIVQVVPDRVLGHQFVAA